MRAGYDVWFTENAAEFLERAGGHLSVAPLTGTIVATVAHRCAAAADRRERPPVPTAWFAVVTGRGGEIAGLAMRTAPHPPYLLRMPDDAAVALADAVLARDEDVAGANGLRPTTDVFAHRIADAAGARVQVAMHTRLFELGRLIEPQPVPGRLRPARRDEAGLALGWIRQFMLDADEQAGRKPGTGQDPEHFTIGDVERKLEEGVLWFWVDEGDRPVHLTAANPPAFGVSRVGPVFTPKEERGRGWASNAVAEVSRMLRDRGLRITLFTDQANPTSNRLYLALGYRAVVDTVELRIS
ncbi:MULTISPECIES: GNAT family N-acetyltransferase [Nocardioides]|uniref:GNAT family N-acetyltransferase n=1 Tax=Nocardioides vastitatis TaxID=2568655 RepID=A0ABW0ZAQ3_9ACTN|nr:GNAT family N-acetyltransferase [Nocardioides sp.]THJ05310.1 GNAT family N-acetyltransferase [Nocardioides sp.]